MRRREKCKKCGGIVTPEKLVKRHLGKITLVNAYKCVKCGGLFAKVGE